MAWFTTKSLIYSIIHRRKIPLKRAKVHDKINHLIKYKNIKKTSSSNKLLLNNRSNLCIINKVKTVKIVLNSSLLKTICINLIILYKYKSKQA